MLTVQQQPLLHQSSSSPKGKEKAGPPPDNGASAASSSAPAENGKDSGSSSEAYGDSADKKPYWPHVAEAEVNEPVGIITIEDVLEELIGQVCFDLCSYARV